MAKVAAILEENEFTAGQLQSVVFGKVGTKVAVEPTAAYVADRLLQAL
jgi:hypothetical protein